MQTFGQRMHGREFYEDLLKAEYFVSQYSVLDCKDTDYSDLLAYLPFLVT